MRWGIERLFGHLKKNGFALEATRMSATAPGGSPPLSTMAESLPIQLDFPRLV